MWVLISLHLDFLSLRNAHTIEPTTAWAHQTTEPTTAWKPDDRADYCLSCSFLPQWKHRVLFLHWSVARPMGEQ